MAKKAIDYKTEKFDEEILKQTDGKGVDVIVDFISGPYFKMNIESLKTDGRLIILVSLGGGNVDEFDLRKILVKRLSVIGSTLRSRSLDYQIKLTKEFSEFALDRFKHGKIKPVIDSVFCLENAAEAHRDMEANKSTGKIVMEVN